MTSVLLSAPKAFPRSTTRSRAEEGTIGGDLRELNEPGAPPAGVNAIDDDEEEEEDEKGGEDEEDEAIAFKDWMISSALV